MTYNLAAIAVALALSFFVIVFAIDPAKNKKDVHPRAIILSIILFALPLIVFLIGIRYLIKGW